MSFFEMMIIWTSLVLNGSLPVGLPPAEPDPLLAQIAPEDCVAYLSWAGLAESDPDSQNHTEQLLADPQVQALLTQVPEFADILLMSYLDEDESMQPLKEHIGVFLEVALTRSTAIYLSELQVENSHISVEGGMAIRLGDDFVSLTQTMLELRPLLDVFPNPRQVTYNDTAFFEIDLPGGHQVTWGLHNMHLLIGVGENQIPAMLENLNSPAPSWHTEIVETLAVDRQSLVAYLNARSILEFVEPLWEVDDIRVAADALGLGNVRCYGLVKGLDQTGVVSQGRLFLDGAPRGVLSVLDADPLDAQCMAPVPEDAAVAGAIRLDPELLFDVALGVVEALDPEKEEEFRQSLIPLNTTEGIDLYDFFSCLGDSWTVHASPSESASLITGWTFTVDLRDAEQLQHILSHLRTSDVQLNSPFAQFRFLGNEIGISQTEFQGHTLYALRTRLYRDPGLFPSILSLCVVDDRLVFSPFISNIKAYLQRDDDFRSIADTELIASHFAADEGPTLLLVADEKSYVSELYPWAIMLTRIIANDLSQHERIHGVEISRIDFSNLPSANALFPHLGKLQLSFSARNQGIESRLQQVLPHGGGALGSLMLPTQILGNHLKVLQQRESLASHSLDEISRALERYRNVHGSYPPAYSTDEQGNPLLSWRVLILPELAGHHEAPALYDEFRLDEPWDSPHNIQLLDRIPRIYAGIDWYDGDPDWQTQYQTICHPDSIFPGDLAIRSDQITDEFGETIFLVQVDQAHVVPWSAPQDYVPTPENPTEGLELHSGGFYAATGPTDRWRTTRLFRGDITPAEFNSLMTRNGSEVINLRSLLHPSRNNWDYSQRALDNEFPPE